MNVNIILLFLKKSSGKGCNPQKNKRIVLTHLYIHYKLYIHAINLLSFRALFQLIVI